MAPQRVGDMTLEELKEFVTDLAEEVVTRKVVIPASAPEKYDPAEDPTIALTGGPSDFSEHAEEILYGDINARDSSQKDQA